MEGAQQPIRRRVPKIEPVQQSEVQALLSRQGQEQQSVQRQAPVQEQQRQQISENSVPIGLQQQAAKHEDTRLVQQTATQISAAATAVTVPSRGFFYEDSGCSDGVFYLRPMTVAEEKILTTARLVRNGEAIDRILMNCIEKPKFSIGRLLLGDKAYLIIALRQLSYGNEYEFGLKCGNCEEQYTDTIDLSKLNVNYLQDDFTNEDLKVTLPVCGKVIQIRLMTSEDEDRIGRLQKSRAKVSSAKDFLDETMVDRLALSIVTIDGQEFKQGDMNRFLNSMSVRDSEALRDKIQEYTMGINLELISDCPFCKGENELTMPIDANFFRATRRKSTAQRV